MKKAIFVCLLIFGFCCYGQNNIQLSLQQDFRLFFFGDKKGNDPLTLNFLSRIEIPVYNLKNTHIVASASVEYADLIEKDYKRYALGAGYIVHRFYGRIGGGAYIDFGEIYRENEGFYSFSISGEINYKISERLKIIFTSQLTQRKDLSVLYNSKGYLISGFFGLKFSL